MRNLFVLPALLALLMLTACSSSSSGGGGMVYNMGEKVTLGKLTYTVQDTEWLDQLGEAPKARVPQHRFLSVRLSVTNSGSGPASIPSLVLTNARGDSYAELTNGEGLAEWLGYLRTINPAQTERGRVLFDAPAGTYRLRLVDDSDPDNERLALVELPFQLPATMPRPEPTGLPAR